MAWHCQAAGKANTAPCSLCQCCCSAEIKVSPAAVQQVTETWSILSQSEVTQDPPVLANDYIGILKDFPVKPCCAPRTKTKMGNLSQLSVLLRTHCHHFLVIRPLKMVKLIIRASWHTSEGGVDNHYVHITSMKVSAYLTSMQCMSCTPWFLWAPSSSQYSESICITMLLAYWWPVCSNYHGKGKKGKIQRRIKSYKNSGKGIPLNIMVSWNHFNLKGFKSASYPFNFPRFLNPIVKSVTHTVRLLFTIAYNLFC